MLLVLEEDDLLDEDFLVLLEEFITGVDISRLFAPEQVTTIVNSIRGDVLLAGLEYTRHGAWQFFRT